MCILSYILFPFLSPDSSSVFAGLISAKQKISNGVRDKNAKLASNNTNDLGILPTRNFQTGVFEGADKISGETF